DTTLYGADATVYLASGAHLARRGSFSIEAPLLHQLPASVLDSLFPAYSPQVPDIRVRSPAGLAYDQRAEKGRVYSSFAKLPSVWVAIGFALGGTPGALVTSAIRGAAGTMAYYLFLRRTLGVWVALVGTGLLLPAVPQLVFARVSMAEIGGQFFLWSGLLAL